MPWYSSIDEAYGPLTGSGPPGQSAPSEFDTRGYKTQTEPITPTAQAPLTGFRQGPLIGAPRLEHSLEAEQVAKAPRQLGDSAPAPGHGPEPNSVLGQGPAPFIRQMSSCEDFQVHLRNCPNCRAYMRGLLADGQEKPTSDGPLREGFSDMLSGNNVDLLVLVGLGVFLIFVLDSLARLSRNLR